MINRNKIKSGNVFSQPIAFNKNIDKNQDVDGDNLIDTDREHPRQLRSVLSAGLLSSSSSLTGKNNNYRSLI